MSPHVETIPMKFHPRAFAAFGADLVTNDCVAVVELVKNCYDAFATNVSVKICSEFLEIRDDGFGMTAEIIRDAWAVIATPYKKKEPIVWKDGKARKVSGNKGLGRFSAARLGRYLEITTKNASDSAISASIDWESFATSSSMSDCVIELSYNNQYDSIFSNTGTIIKIYGLYSKWDTQKTEELQNALSRLMSPFETVDDFRITLQCESSASPVFIKPHEFISHPTYSIIGKVSTCGNILWNYTFDPRNNNATKRSGEVAWSDAQKGFEGRHIIEVEEPMEYSAGPFSFEIRAWDLDTESIADVSEHFNIGKREIRSSIAQYKGLSVYRDNILVLPKSDATKDWLGIDIRRVSSIGKRLSTSQIIGMINISSDLNSEIKDTTDREKLVDTPEYKQFSRIVQSIIVVFENLKNIDKTTPEKAPRALNNLIAPLYADSLVSKLELEHKRGGSSAQLIETVREYAATNEKALGELTERLTYYAQTASLGSVSIVLLHEILTGMTVIKRFLNRIRKVFTNADKKTVEYLEQSENWHERLIDLANCFAPLYRKNLHSKKEVCNLKAEIWRSVRLILNKKDAKDVKFSVDVDEDINVSVFQGELQTILINLLDNAVYWINYSNKEKKQIQIRAQNTVSDKILVSFSDTGVGIRNEEAEKIFQPGITSKPHGIGMGLVIITELLNNYDCKIATVVPGYLGGATFEFELPKE